ncbi:MAG: chitobiase/beta-hexosaminidase C-terminal domain-containing protein, partial [Kiritimatiellae bacterium]|nr:chitobiase/beta-hexosaminidase C-terminal domain-containing protein [Kiritimatiellia bacterium]
GGGGLLRATEAPAADAGALAPGDGVTLLLFDGEQVDLVVEEASATTFSGSRAFLARTKGSEFLDAVILADADGRLHARIQGFDEGRVLRVFPRDGATAVEESEPTPVVEDGERPVAEPEAAPAPTPEANDGGDAPLAAAPPQTDHVVDVFVGFDRGAKAWAQKNGGTTNFAETAVQNMNLALANSNLEDYFRYRLVGIGFVDERDTDVETALNHATHGNDGWSVVRPAAEACGADVVTVLIDTGIDSGVTGIAWGLRETTARAAAHFDAINACAIRAVAKGETMTHEVGHNLGCGHANTKGQSAPGPQSFPYSSGYHFTGTDGKRYHTIMGYNSVGGEQYELANVFSSPELTFAGKPAGTVASNDNRRVLTQTWEWAVGWRDAVVPISYDVFFTPGSGTSIDGSLDVTLAPGKSGLPIRYTLDGSAPTLSSALYSGPIRLTGTTTIRAATVLNGVLGPVCTARYHVPGLAEAVDTPDVVWSTSSSYPWTFQTETTWDGADAAKSGSCQSWYSTDKGLYATVTGPAAMTFRWCATMHNTEAYMQNGDPMDELVVFVDGERVWSDSGCGHPSEWKRSQAEIPEGTHEVSFRFQRIKSNDTPANVGGWEYAVWLDTVSFAEISRPPVLSPATTDAEATATTFVGAQTVSISASGGADTLVFYTTDGSDPAENGVLYGGPFEITDSTGVRAIAVEPGLDPSVETSGMYLERHRPILPGEWTADVDGLLADAAADSSARLILGLYSCAGTQPQCEPFRAVAEDPAFTSWCAANGVYLLVSDTTIHPDGAAARTLLFDWMKRLHPNSTPIYGPMLVAAHPDGTLYAADAADTFALFAGGTFGTETYDGSVASLVACLASIIGEASLSPPTATPDAELVDGFPVSVRLSNPNASGTIRYTIDGSAPTRSSTVYNGSAIQIQNGQILSATVFPANASDLTSAILRKKYCNVAGFFGVPEDAFDWNRAAGDYPWRVFPVATVPTLRSGNNGSSEYGPIYQSVLRAVARSAGTLSFSFGDMNYVYNTSVFTAPDGTQTSVRSPNMNAIEWTSLSVDVQPGDVLLWTRDVENSYCEFEEYDLSSGTVYCGAFLRNLVWTPAGGAPELGTVSVAATATGATVSVPVSALGEGSSSATVTVAVDGVERTQTLDAPGTATFVFSGLEPGTPYTAAVTAVNSNGGTATASEAFSTEALPFVGWFDVKWASDGYGTGTAWWNAAAERTSGGTWTVPAGDASSRSGSALELALPEGGDLRFTAVSPSAGGGYVTVDGTVSPVPTRALPDLPAGAFAALSFARGGYKAWNGAQWVSLSGAAPAASDTPWTATFDFSSSPPRVRYAVGGKTLSASGSAWIPLASAPDYVRGVGYAGGGAVGNFKASYAGGGFVAPVLCTAADGHVPLSFGKDASNAPTFEVTIRNAVKDAWYTVYAADTVDGTYKAVTSEKATADGLKTLSIPAPSSKPARFVRIGVSDAQIPANTAL